MRDRLRPDLALRLDRDAALAPFDPLPVFRREPAYWSVQDDSRPVIWNAVRPPHHGRGTTGGHMTTVIWGN
jgi:hypothetical protein